MASVIYAYVVKLSVKHKHFMLNVVLLSVVMLNVAGPHKLIIIPFIFDFLLPLLSFFHSSLYCYLPFLFYLSLFLFSPYYCLPFLSLSVYFHFSYFHSFYFLYIPPLPFFTFYIFLSLLSISFFL
jgi:hypothetical protein